MIYDVNPVTSEKPLDCGPTCLKMLLAYYGTDVPLGTLVEECGLTLVGATGKTLMEVGRSHGLDMQCWSIDADEVLRQDRPIIVHWKFGHWVVFCGTDGDGRACICNPDIGRFRMSPETFMAYATGLDDHPGQVVCLSNGEPKDVIATAPGNYSQGEIFDLNGTLYRALIAIASGEALTEYNCEAVDMAATLNELETKETING